MHPLSDMRVSEFFKSNILLKRYYARLIVVIAITWTVYDYFRFVGLAFSEDKQDYPFLEINAGMSITRIVLALIAHILMAFALIFPIKEKFRHIPIWINFILKSLMLCLCSILFSIFFFVIAYLVFYGKPFLQTFNELNYFLFNTPWITDSSFDKLKVFVITLFVLEINEKYSPGIFAKIFFGRYLRPREENRIIMFIDLKNSTPIAEKLGHQKYFYFIRDFIHHISMALLEYDGLIYQYVGDEIVVSWISNKGNKDKCIQSLIKARKLIEKDSTHYRNTYGVIPEFRVGIHIGVVTVGEVGIVKKDLAISGDAMNTTARIRSASSELNQKFMASADFVEFAGLKDFQVENMGDIDLKGKGEPLLLYALRI